MLLSLDKEHAKQLKQKLQTPFLLPRDLGELRAYCVRDGFPMTFPKH